MFIYLGITLSQIVLLTLGGMDLFDSICHSFGTVATGGFSTKNTSIAGYSPYIQYVMALYMFLSATSYVVYYYIVRRKFRQIESNEEFWFYIFFTTAAIVFVTLVLFTGTERPFEESFRHAVFQVVSQISCTGFATTDYTVWPYAGIFFMFLLMFAGGSTGSTTGGIKMARHLISLKNLRSVIVRLQHPNAVAPVKLNGKIVPEDINHLMTVFIQLYLIIFVIRNPYHGCLRHSNTGVSRRCRNLNGRHWSGSRCFGKYGQFCAFHHYGKADHGCSDVPGPS